MTSIFRPIDIEADLDSLRFAASTADLAYHDPEIERFVSTAFVNDLPPAVFETSGRTFPWFVPEVLWDAPMWIHWLGSEHDAVIDELAHVRLDCGDLYSTDLLTRRQVLCWNTETTSFCTSARDLTRSLACAHDNEVLSVFVSPERFVSNPTWVSDELVQELAVMHHYCGSNYKPHVEFDRKTHGPCAGSVRSGGQRPQDRCCWAAHRQTQDVRFASELAGVN